MSITLGVVIPVYNAENYIEACLSSVVGQLSPFDEVIIIDDGSTDSSAAICQRFANEYGYIQFFSQKNSGVAAARNVGITKATADYLCFLDSDDYIRNDYVECVKKELEKDRPDILYFDADTISDIPGKTFGNPYDRMASSTRDKLSGKDYFSFCYPDLYMESPCLSAYSRKLLDENNISFPDYRLYEDNFFSFVVMNCAETVRYIPEKLYIRRYRDQSIMTSKFTLDKWIQVAGCFGDCRDYICRNYSYYNDANAEAMLRFIIHTYLVLCRKIQEISEVSNEEQREFLLKEQSRIIESLAVIKPNLPDDLSVITCRELVSFSLEIKEIAAELEVMLNSDGMFNRAQQKYNIYLKELFDRLSLDDESKTIGIYGMGVHTEFFLNWYEALKGKIEAKLFFVDTYVESESKRYKGWPVINVQDVSKYGIEEVIISSNRFELQMYETLRDKYGYSGVIHRFYEVGRQSLFCNR